MDFRFFDAVIAILLEGEKAMAKKTKPEDRDDVLFAFHRATSDPTAEEICDWVRRHPQFADDIRAHAEILKEWADRENLPEEALDEALLMRSRSRALNTLHNAKVGPRLAKLFRKLGT
jgi:hypothetical protein